MNTKLLFFKIIFTAFIVFVASLSTGFAQEVADNCEISSSKLARVGNDFAKMESSQRLFLVVKLGKSEKLMFSKRRLFTVSEYLIASNVKRDKIIFANGERTIGLGSVEIYLEGKLFDVIYAKKNADIPVGICDNLVEDRKFQLSGKIKNQVVRKKK